VTDHLHQALKRLFAGDRVHPYPSAGFDRPNIGRWVGFTGNCDHCNSFSVRLSNRFQHRYVDMLARLRAMALIDAAEMAPKA